MSRQRPIVEGDSTLLEVELVNDDGTAFDLTGANQIQLIWCLASDEANTMAISMSPTAEPGVVVGEWDSAFVPPADDDIKAEVTMLDSLGLRHTSEVLGYSIRKRKPIPP